VEVKQATYIGQAKNVRGRQAQIGVKGPASSSGTSCETFGKGKYGKLNDLQCDGVIEDHVLLIQSQAGTGKTTVIAANILIIIKHGKMKRTVEIKLTFAISSLCRKISILTASASGMSPFHGASDSRFSPFPIMIGFDQ